MASGTESVLFFLLLGWTTLLCGPGLAEMCAAHRRVPLLAQSWPLSAALHYLVDVPVVLFCCTTWFARLDPHSSSLQVATPFLFALQTAGIIFRRKARGLPDAYDRVGAAACGLLDAGASFALFVVWAATPEPREVLAPWVLALWWIHIALALAMAHRVNTLPPPPPPPPPSAAEKSDSGHVDAGERRGASKRERRRNTINVTCPSCNVTLYIDDND